MKRLFTLFGVLFAVCLLAVVALLGWVMTFDANDNKPWLADKFQSRTGHELKLDGDIAISLYPWLGLNANDVSIGNASGFSATPLLQAGHAEFRIKLLPLLDGNLEIDTVRFDAVNINLEVAGNGQDNWSALLSSQEKTAVSTPQSGSIQRASETQQHRILLGGVSITNSALTYDNRFNDTHYQLSNINLSIAELEFGEPLDLNLQLQATSQRPQLAADIHLQGTAMYDLDADSYQLAPLLLDATLRGPGVPSGASQLSARTNIDYDSFRDTVTIDSLRVDALDSEFNASLSIERASSATPVISARVDARGDDLSRLFLLIEQNALASRISRLNRHYALSAQLELNSSTGQLRMPDLQAQLLDADISGNMLISGFNSETPVISGELNASGPDLPTLIEVVGLLEGGSNSALSQAGRELSRAPDKQFSIQTRFYADLQTAVVDLPQFSSSLFGASINGNLHASNIKQMDALQAQGNINAQGPDLALLMQIAGQLQGGRNSAINTLGLKIREQISDRSFRISTDFNTDLQQGRIQLPTLSARALGFELDARLDASNLQDSNSRISGSLRLEGKELAALLRVLDQPDLAAVVNNITLQMEVGGSSANLRLSPLQAEVTLSGRQIPSGSQQLTVSADTTLNLENNSLRSDDFSVRGLGLNLSGNLRAENLNGNMSYQGELTLPTVNARRLLQQLNKPLPAMNDGSVLQQVSLNAGFAGTSNSFNLNRLQAQLDDSTISGTLAISDLANLNTRFTLSIDQLNADRYMMPATNNPGDNSAASQPLPTETLRDLTLDGQLTIGKLTLNRLQMSAIDISVEAANGQLSVYPFNASLYGGSFAGDVRLDSRESIPAASVATTFSNVDVGALLKDYMDATFITGTGNIRFSLTGSGNDVASIKRGLNGDGSLSLNEGVLQGVDVSAVLNTIETMIRTRQILSLPEGGSTAFDKSAASLLIRNGVVTTKDLSVKAPGWQLAGTGVLADLNTETLDFNMLVEVDESTVSSADTDYNLGGYRLPIACSGRFDKPRCLPDARQIIQAAIGNVVQRRLGEFLQERLGNSTSDNAPQNSETGQQTEPNQQPQEPRDPATELLNRTLDRLLR